MRTAELGTLGLALLVACAPSDSDGDPNVVPPPAVWALEETHRFGSLDDAETLLTRVQGVVVGESGEVYVGQPRDHAILVYDSTGTRTGSIGSEGEGPGEFRSLASFGLKADSVFLVDRGLLRMTVFTNDGEFVRTVRWPSGRIPGVGTANHWPDRPIAAALLADDTVVYESGRTTSPTPESRGVVEMDYPTLILRTRLQPLPSVGDTVVHSIAQLRALYVLNSGALHGLSIPLPDYPMGNVAPNGGGAVTVTPRPAPDLDAATYTVHVISPAGDTVHSSSVPYAPKSVPRELLEEIATENDARLRDLAGRPSPSAQIDALDGAGLIPPTIPPVTGLVVGQDGSIWLRREDLRTDSIAWDVLDARGDRQGQVMLPRGQTVQSAYGDVMVTLELGEYDEPYLVRYRIVR